MRLAVTGACALSFCLALSVGLTACGPSEPKSAASPGATSGPSGRTSPDVVFSAEAYLAANPDVKAAGMDPLQHYKQYGWKEGRNPTANFNTRAYLKRYPDVATSGLDPLTQYLQAGRAAGRQIQPAIGRQVADDGFDREYYLLTHPEVRATGLMARPHFETRGWQAGLNPNAYFDVRAYEAANPDVKTSGMNPLQHYDKIGWKRGANPSARFDTRAYLAANPDVAKAGLNPLVHFLKYGAAEGRNPSPNAAGTQ